MPTFRNTLCSIFIARYLPTCLWRWNRQCPETSAYNVQTPGNYPEANIQHTEHVENFKSRISKRPLWSGFIRS